MIQVGQVLDKYELLERVGQGGMAVVYRALDRSLRRTVALKILHRHLADSGEARDRFEREAHAVAKLRHDNIVEIFAYSGKKSEDSYIVTEFIDGPTLKQFIGDHPLSFPEVGAMIVLQVCRALAHAHGCGVLHRDVKPENVMIRSDGTVKLMDFGISQMVDLQRLTVTGQLLGSPAYMSPEHVEGQPLDFRTDVFAIGIVLYQLTVGRLPFEGKNPHEILKRIAECKFADPRQANPRIGNELGKIILRAMARLPDDRFGDISEMVAALDAYCSGSGLGPAAQELMRYFQSPAAYELALKERLVDHLARKGKANLPHAKPSALEAFDRVLALDPNNATVLGVLEKMRGTRRWKHGVAIGVALLVIAGLAFGARRMIERGKATPTSISKVDIAGTNPTPERVTITVPDSQRVDERPAGAPDAEIASNGGGGVPDRPRPAIDAEPAVTSKVVVVNVQPASSTLSIENGPGQSAPNGNGRFEVAVPIGERVRVQAANSDPTYESIGATLDGSKDEINLELGRLPAELRLTCDVDKVSVTVDGQPRRAGDTVPIPFGTSTMAEKNVTVEFITEAKVDGPKKVTVKAGEKSEIKCDL